MALVLRVSVRQSTGDIRKDKGLISKANSAARRRRPGLRVCGLFAAVWLNLALQPCAMAMEADLDCPHCPPQHEQHMAGHAGHAVEAQKAPCDSLDTDCCDLDDVSVDGRAGQAKLKEMGEAPVAITVVVASPAVRVPKSACPATGPPRWAADSPPIHVLNCVYLK